MADRRDTSWMREAACRHEHPSVFFPNDGLGVIRAQRICADCPMQQRCLAYALVHGIEFGVWGGTSERQRRLLARQYRRQKATSTGATGPTTT